MENTNFIEEMENESTALEVVNPETGEVTTNEEIEVKPSAFTSAEISGFMNASAKLAKAKKTISIVPQYMEFGKQGETERGIFMGYTVINKKDELHPGQLVEIKCIQWLNNGKMYMNGGVALVDKFKSLPVGTPVEIEYTGKGSNGKTKVFDVTLLEI